MKRILDFCLALALFAVALPVMAMIALLVRWRMGGPVLFRQLRPGLAGRPFVLYKFRTMTDETNPGGEPLPDAQRLTPLGAVLRRLSLDELPQLINVLKGDMSLVGPRPLLMEYLPLYDARQARRHEVRPGITGWAQVNGRNAVGWPERLEMDVWYVEHQGFLLDLRILGLTVLRVVRGSGVAQPGEATMRKFRGSAERDG